MECGFLLIANENFKFTSLQYCTGEKSIPLSEFKVYFFLCYIIYMFSNFNIDVLQ